VSLAGLVGCGERPAFTPVGDVVQLPEAFRWPATGAASSYMVRIFGSDGSVIHESRPQRSNALTIDDDLRNRLNAAREFSWRIRIYDGDRIAGTSDPVNVVVVTAPRP
jgi:hypothetical protein